MKSICDLTVEYLHSQRFFWMPAFGIAETGNAGGYQLFLPRIQFLRTALLLYCGLTGNSGCGLLSFTASRNALRSSIQ